MVNSRGAVVSKDKRVTRRKSRFASLVLRWFEKNRREFPWRPPKSAYHAAVAEILLQKTSAGNARPIFDIFIIQFPTVQSLAEADLADVEELIQPLGLPRRAQLLRGMAVEIVSN